MSIFDADLAVICTVRDQEWNFDPFHMPIEIHIGRLCMEIFHIAGAEHPHDMRPVVRHRIFTFLAQAFLLDFGQL